MQARAEKEVSFRNQQGQLLAGLLLAPHASDCCVLLCHCFFCSKNHPLMRRLASSLHEQGVASLRFDFAGFGASQGISAESTQSGMASDISSAASFALSLGFSRIGVFGHSMGGAAAIIAASSDKRISSLCTAGVPADSIFVYNHLSKEEREMLEEHGFVKISAFSSSITVSKRLVEDARGIDLLSCAEKIACPFCVLHAEKDELLSAEHAERISSASRNAVLKVVGGAGHLFTSKNGLEAVSAIVCDWFRRTLCRNER